MEKMTEEQKSKLAAEYLKLKAFEFLRANSDQLNKEIEELIKMKQQEAPHDDSKPASLISRQSSAETSEAGDLPEIP